MKKVLLILMVAALATGVHATTIAHWNYEGASLGPFDADGGGNDGVASVEGITMYGWDDYWGPSVVTGIGGNQMMQNLDHHQDGYVYSTGATDPAQALIDFSSPTWTIEATFKLDSDGTGDIGGWQTLIGRDGSGASAPGSGSVLYFQKTWDNYFRIDFATVGGERWEAGSWTTGLQVQADHWYSMAATSDGTTLSLYVNDLAAGTGYQLITQTDMSSDTDTTMDITGGNWTFGRGWWNGGFVDHIDGWMDDIRISDTALAMDELIVSDIPEPATMVLLGLGALAALRKRK